MLLKIAKTTALVALTALTLNAGEFNKQAEKDRLALIDYFETKFKDAKANKGQFFPYASEEELESSYFKNIKHHDFAKGNYSFNKDGKSQYNALNDFPPYETAVYEGEDLYNKKYTNGEIFKSCFPNPAIVGDYPYFDDNRNEVVTLTTAINECLVENGEKAWNPKKGKLAKLEAYFAYETRDAGKKLDIKIPSKAAEDAYKRGKEYYYTQRGYLKLSCASCHVQGSGQRVRNEKLSPFLGQVTHFPVYRLKWQGLGTLERRMSGCVKDAGQVPPKADSKEMKELLYFMAYMSAGMSVDGPDIRK